MLKPVRGNQPGSVVEEDLCGNQGEGEGDDERGEEEGLEETGDHCRPAKRRRERGFYLTRDGPVTPALL